MSEISIANQIVTASGGRQIAYFDSGSQGNKGGSSEPVIVLLHGFCGSSAYWERIVPLLENKGRIIVPDLRGHGRSSAPEEQVYEIDAFADDLLLLLNELGLESVSLFGHSLGGYVALAFAERSPDRLKSLSLVHSTAKPDSEEAKKNRDKAAAAIQEKGIHPFVDGLIPKLFAPKHLESMEPIVKHIIEIGYGTSGAGAAATAQGMKTRPDRTGVLSQLHIPLLLIAGSEDAIIPAENTFTTKGPHVTQVVLDGSGHMSMVESPAALGERISAFMSYLSTI
ncbi:alpha/beta hydrolase [Paenibacillus baekrokdamisoli]|uniref:Alpha/beta hydrolase n=1 Tax=Paenibacillus baekrokdamisoli TaxID=1712516 RepID=A0A3G9J0D0_9BACL|nr:alpha/beta hydrolase [Paenibacillus baekrokdamisoli]MBB3071686.1 pimeloyl-ACP methyl ester carboxylesterase [Paenibacillus baekrokdamisoli]BBH21805.1 alpha/beta hydrolase [Paenibacillus baekrokdamisoli]